MITPQASATTVLLTDYAWPDTGIERRVIEGAGYRLVTGPSAPASAATIEAMVREHQPAAIMTCWAQVSSEAILASPGLRIVARMGVGLDNIAVATATEVGAWVTNVPDYCVEEVSDHALAMVLAWTRGLLTYDRQVRAGIWNPAAAQLRRLASQTCGILGYGAIGRRTAAKLAMLGARVLVHTRSGAGLGDGVEAVSLERLLQESDAVIVHVPLTNATQNLLSRERIAAMKPGALLVNVSRGGIVDTLAVIDALEAGHLSAAGLDVLDSEPQVPSRLLAQTGAMLTPHVAFSSDASLGELRQRACEEVVRVLRGEAPQHPCNQPQRRLAVT